MPSMECLAEDPRRQQLLDDIARLAVQHAHRGNTSALLVFCLGLLTASLAIGLWYLLLERSNRNYEREKLITHAHQLDPASLRELLGGDNLPPWVRFADVERTTWINAVMAGLWPNIDRAACKWAWENLDQLLNTTDFWRPKWLQTHGVKLHSIILGQEPPIVTGVKVYGKEHQFSREELAMEYDFSWSSRMEVKLVMKVCPQQRFPILGHLISMVSKAVTVKIGIRDLVARGKLRAVLRPLINEIPVVGAVKISFVEAPAFSYQVTVYGGNPLWVPGLEAWINSFIKDEVLRPLIFPDGFIYNLADSTAGTVLERPCGLLDVRVVEARNIPNMDFFTPGDPYVKLYVRERLRLHTTVKSNTGSPVWNEDFQLLVHDTGLQSLYLSIWDSDVFSSDDLIGSIEIPLRELDLTPGAMNDLWLPMRGPGERRQRRRKWLPRWLARRKPDGEASSDESESESGSEDRSRARQYGWGSGSSYVVSGGRRDHLRRRRTVARIPRSAAQQAAAAQQEGALAAQAPQQPVPGSAMQGQAAGPFVQQQQQQGQGHGGEGSAVVEQATTRRVLPPLARAETLNTQASSTAVKGSPPPSPRSLHPESAASWERGPPTPPWPKDAVSPSAAWESARGGSSVAGGEELGLPPSASQATLQERGGGSRGSGSGIGASNVGDSGGGGDGNELGGRQGSGLAGLGRLSGGMVGRQARQAFEGLERHGKEALQQVRHVMATALPQKKVCQLHVQVSYSPFTKQEILQAEAAQQPGSGQFDRLSTRQSRIYQVLRGGVLYIHLNQAQNLVKGRGLVGGLTKNIRCKVRVGSHKKQTERGKRTSSRNPVFDQTMEFILDADTVADEECEIRLEVHSVSRVFPSDFKGRVVIPLRMVIERQRMRDVWQLEGASSGQISMELEWLGAMGL